MSADRDKLRELLERLLLVHCPHLRGTADALLPVVDRIANERAAAELRAAGKAWREGRANPDGLDDRADALDPP